MDKFNAGGVIGACCGHNIPLLLTNINTPGEQQKYTVALIQHIFSLISKKYKFNHFLQYWLCI